MDRIVTVLVTRRTLIAYPSFEGSFSVFTYVPAMVVVSKKKIIKILARGERNQTGEVRGAGWIRLG